MAVEQGRHVNTAGTAANLPPPQPQTGNRTKHQGKLVLGRVQRNHFRYTSMTLVSKSKHFTCNVSLPGVGQPGVSRPTVLLTKTLQDIVGQNTMETWNRAGAAPLKYWLGGRIAAVLADQATINPCWEAATPHLAQYTYYTALPSPSHQNQQMVKKVIN